MATARNQCWNPPTVGRRNKSVSNNDRRAYAAPGTLGPPQPTGPRSSNLFAFKSFIDYECIGLELGERYFR